MPLQFKKRSYFPPSSIKNIFIVYIITAVITNLNLHNKELADYVQRTKLNLCVSEKQLLYTR